MTALDEASHRTEISRFTLRLAVVALVLILVPTLVGFILAPQGAMYLQQQMAMDDQMVYAAWMKQAMQGRFLFDNRFAVDPQPGLTLHLYFLILGWVAKLTGIPLAMTLARAGFSFLFVILLGRLVAKLDWPIYSSKLAMVLAVFGMGLGFAAWEPFGRDILHESPVGILTGGRLPIDVWQPEAFAFSSMLTNGLFMASLCLFLVIILAVLDARTTWRAVPLGFGAFFVLMNIHSYDVLLLTFVLLGFLVACVAGKTFTTAWILRAAVIGSGAILPALWFMHVLSQDEVFQARAETLTYTDNFRQIFAGLLPLIVLALIGAVRGVYSQPETIKDEEAEEGTHSQTVLIGACLFIALILGMLFLAGAHAPDSYFMTLPIWIACFGATLAAIYLLKPRNPLMAMICAWAFVGLIAPYFPGLFQRKLSMGMAIPWGLLAAMSLGDLIKSFDRSKRNIATALGLVVGCASALLWVQREMVFIKSNVSSTALHPVTLSSDIVSILDALDQQPGRKVVVAMPGIWAEREQKGTFDTPYMPDLNPFASGLTGAYTYAGHWSETPKYIDRRGIATSIFHLQTPDETRYQLIRETGAQYLIAPNPESFSQLPLADLKIYGEVIKESGAWALIRLPQEPSPQPEP